MRKLPVWASLMLTTNFAYTKVCCATPESVISHYGPKRRAVALQGEAAGSKVGRVAITQHWRSSPSDWDWDQLMNNLAVMRLVSQDWSIKRGQGYSRAVKTTELEYGSGSECQSSKAAPNRGEVLVRICTVLSHSSLTVGDMGAPYQSWSWAPALQPLTPGGLPTRQLLES